MSAPRLSIVIPTWNRPLLLARLLRQLDEQEFSDYEVVVVDDGSSPPAAIVPAPTRAHVCLVRQENQGAARARHRGILDARGEVIVLLDDDMSVGPGLLAVHAARHAAHERLVLLGRILPDPGLSRMPLFERFHALMLQRFEDEIASGHRAVQGSDVCSGNVSFRRADYLAVGGFDGSLDRSEDAELGIRFAKAGCELRFDPEACARHGSDHASLQVWLRRAHRYGINDRRIGWKHADVPGANPWRFLHLMSPLARPLLLLSALLPAAGFVLARLAMAVATLLDRIGLERPALAGTTVVYGMEYFRGVRRAVGSLPRTLADLRAYAARSAHTAGGA